MMIDAKALRLLAACIAAWLVEVHCLTLEASSLLHTTAQLAASLTFGELSISTPNSTASHLADRKSAVAMATPAAAEGPSSLKLQDAAYGQGLGIIHRTTYEYTSMLLWLAVGTMFLAVSLVAWCEVLLDCVPGVLCRIRVFLVAVTEAIVHGGKDTESSDGVWGDFCKDIWHCAPTVAHWRRHVEKAPDMPLRSLLYAAGLLAHFILWRFLTDSRSFFGGNLVLPAKWGDVAIYVAYVGTMWTYQEEAAEEYPLLSRVTATALITTRVVSPLQFRRVALGSAVTLVYAAPSSAVFQHLCTVVDFASTCICMSLLLALWLLKHAVVWGWMGVKLALKALVWSLLISIKAVCMCWRVMFSIWNCTGNVFVMLGAAETALLAAAAQHLRALKAQLWLQYKHVRRIWRRTNGNIKDVLVQLLTGINSSSSATAAATGRNSKSGGKAGKRGGKAATAAETGSSSSCQTPRTAGGGMASVSVSAFDVSSSGKEEDEGAELLLSLASSLPAGKANSNNSNSTGKAKTASKSKAPTYSAVCVGRAAMPLPPASNSKISSNAKAKALAPSAPPAAKAASSRDWAALSPSPAKSKNANPATTQAAVKHGPKKAAATTTAAPLKQNTAAAAPGAASSTPRSHAAAASPAAVGSHSGELVAAVVHMSSCNCCTAH